MAKRLCVIQDFDTWGDEWKNEEKWKRRSSRLRTSGERIIRGSWFLLLAPLKARMCALTVSGVATSESLEYRRKSRWKLSASSSTVQTWTLLLERWVLMCSFATLSEEGEQD
jgi:hypothetical protein